MTTQNDNFEGVKLQDDNKHFITAVFDLKADRIKCILLCKNHTDPQTKKGTYDVYPACVYTNMSVDGKVINMLDGFPPNKPLCHHLYCLVQASSHVFPACKMLLSQNIVSWDSCGCMMLFVQRALVILEVQKFEESFVSVSVQSTSYKDSPQECLQVGKVYW